MSTTYQLVYRRWSDVAHPDLLLLPPSLSRTNRPRCRTESVCQRWMDNAYLKVRYLKQVLKYFSLASFDGYSLFFNITMYACQFVDTCDLHTIRIHNKFRVIIFVNFLILNLFGQVKPQIFNTIKHREMWINTNCFVDLRLTFCLYFRKPGDEAQKPFQGQSCRIYTSCKQKKINYVCS